MLKLRGNSEHKNLEQAELAAQLLNGQRSLSNVGVSAVLTVNIDDKEYLVLARRQTKEGPRLMLPSGYVDAYRESGEAPTSAALLTEQTLKESHEEVIPVDGDGNIARAKIFQSAISAMLATEIRIIEPSGEDTGLLPALLKPAYPDLEGAYSNDNPYEIHGGYFPACVRSYGNAPTVTVDGQQTDLRFKLDLPNASGQVAAAYRISLPEGSQISLFHAETAPDKERDKETGKVGHFKEVLDPRGLLLAELDDQGEMTGKLCRLQEGRVVPVGEEEFPPDKTRFSEAFNWPVSGVTVPAVDGDIMWSSYFE